jgi:hypothetical protein
MKLIRFCILILVILFWSVTPLIAQEEQEESEDLMDKSLEELLDIILDYGYKEAPVSVHAYMNTALWNFGDQFWGKYANVCGSGVQYPD